MKKLLLATLVCVLGISSLLLICSLSCKEERAEARPINFPTNVTAPQDAGGPVDLVLAVVIGQSTGAGCLGLDAASPYWGTGAPPGTTCAGNALELGDTTGNYVGTTATTYFIARDCAPARPFVDAAIAISQSQTNSSTYPTNQCGEDPVESTLANLPNAFGDAGIKTKHLFAEVNVAMGAQSIACIEPDASGTTTYGGACNAYASALQEIQTWATNAKVDAGVPVRVGWVINYHGEADCTQNWNQFGLPTYQMFQRFQTDVKAITGQTQNITFVDSIQVSRCVTSFPTPQTNYSGREQWRTTYLTWNCDPTIPNNTCVTSGDGRYWSETVEGTHFSNWGDQQEGMMLDFYLPKLEKSLDAGGWPHPLAPIGAVWNYAASTVTISYVLPPGSTGIAIDTTPGQPHCDGGPLSIWCPGYGFGISNGNMNDLWPDSGVCAPVCATAVPITNTTLIQPNQVQLTFGDAGSGLTPDHWSYAFYADNANPTPRTGTADNKDGRVGNFKTNDGHWAIPVPDLPTTWCGAPLDGGTVCWDGGP